MTPINNSKITSPPSWTPTILPAAEDLTGAHALRSYLQGLGR
jgi:hypothetical protein